MNFHKCCVNNKIFYNGYFMLQLRLTEELNVALMLISEKILLLVVHTYDISVTNKPAKFNTNLFLKTSSFSPMLTDENRTWMSMFLSDPNSIDQKIYKNVFHRTSFQSVIGANKVLNVVNSRLKCKMYKLNQFYWNPANSRLKSINFHLK